jgi:hypothetical protein
MTMTKRSVGTSSVAISALLWALSGPAGAGAISNPTDGKCFSLGTTTCTFRGDLIQSAIFILSSPAYPPLTYTGVFLSGASAGDIVEATATYGPPLAGADHPTWGACIVTVIATIDGAMYEIPGDGQCLFASSAEALINDFATQATVLVQRFDPPETAIRIDAVSPGTLVRGEVTDVLVMGADLAVGSGPSTVEIDGTPVVAVSPCPPSVTCAADLLQFTTVAAQVDTLGTHALTVKRADGAMAITTVLVIDALAGPIGELDRNLEQVAVESISQGRIALSAELAAVTAGADPVLAAHRLRDELDALGLTSGTEIDELVNEALSALAIVGPEHPEANRVLLAAAAAGRIIEGNAATLGTAGGLILGLGGQDIDPVGPIGKLIDDMILGYEEIAFTYLHSRTNTLAAVAAGADPLSAVASFRDEVTHLGLSGSAEIDELAAEALAALGSPGPSTPEARRANQITIAGKMLVRASLSGGFEIDKLALGGHDFD